MLKLHFFPYLLFSYCKDYTQLQAIYEQIALWQSLSSEQQSAKWPILIPFLPGMSMSYMIYYILPQTQISKQT